MEIWQQIFWEASHIDHKNEFTTKPRLHNRILWDPEYDDCDGRMDAEDLQYTLETRRHIVLVCKTWYTMGIEILYSHLRIPYTMICDDLTFYGLLTDTCGLLRYTKRLVLEPCSPNVLSSISVGEAARRSAWICTSLPRLLILEAPGTVLPLFPLQSLPSSLEVAILKNNRDYYYNYIPRNLSVSPRPLPIPWCGVRVLDVHTEDLKLCKLDHPQAVIFDSLEELLIRETTNRSDPEDKVVRFIVDNWLAPRLRGLMIIDTDGRLWIKFLHRHAATLRTLCLNQWGIAKSSWSEDKDGPEIVELPALKALYIDFWDRVPRFIVNGVERVAVYDIGDSEGADEVESHIFRATETFPIWETYPNIKSCYIAGWEEVIEWLEEQPEVVDFVKRMEERQVKVDFIRLGDQVLGIADF